MSLKAYNKAGDKNDYIKKLNTQNAATFLVEVLDSSDKKREEILFQLLTRDDRRAIILNLPYLSAAKMLFHTYEILRVHKNRSSSKNKQSREILSALLEHPNLTDILYGLNKEGDSALHVAAACQEFGVIETMLKNGASPEHKNNAGETPLQSAVKSHDNQMIAEALLTRKVEGFWANLVAFFGFAYRVADVNAQDNLRNTPLHLASQNSHPHTCKKLIEYGAQTDIVNAQGDMALHSAVNADKPNVVTALLGKVDNGIWPNMRKWLSSIRKDANKYSNFGRMTRSVLKNLLVWLPSDKKPILDINGKDSKGRTALQLAIKKGNQTIIDVLLDAGADIHLQDDARNTALHYAAWHGNLDTIKRLMNANADVHQRNDLGQTPLHVAAKQGNVEIVKNFIVQGPEVTVCTEFKGKFKVNLDHELANSHKAIDFILKNRDMVVRKNAVNGTALLFESKYKNNPVQLHLHPLGSHRAFNVNEVDRKGKSPLHHAVEKNKVDVVKLLLLMGADINAVDHFGRTSLHVAVKFGQDNIVTMLLENPSINLNVKDNGGKTACRTAIGEFYKNPKGDNVENILKCKRLINLKRLELDLKRLKSEKPNSVKPQKAITWLSTWLEKSSATKHFDLTALKVPKTEESVIPELKEVKAIGPFDEIRACRTPSP